MTLNGYKNKSWHCDNLSDRFTFDMRILALLSVVVVVCGEPPAPYPASGWKPQGQPFVLPSRQEIQPEYGPPEPNTQYLPSLDRARNFAENRFSSSQIRPEYGAPFEPNQSGVSNNRNVQTTYNQVPDRNTQANQQNFNQYSSPNVLSSQYNQPGFNQVPDRSTQASSFNQYQSPNLLNNQRGFNQFPDRSTQGSQQNFNQYQPPNVLSNQPPFNQFPTRNTQVGSQNQYQPQSTESNQIPSPNTPNFRQVNNLNQPQNSNSAPQNFNSQPQSSQNPQNFNSQPQSSQNPQSFNNQPQGRNNQRRKDGNQSQNPQFGQQNSNQFGRLTQGNNQDNFQFEIIPSTSLQFNPQQKRLRQNPSQTKSDSSEFDVDEFGESRQREFNENLDVDDVSTPSREYGAAPPTRTPEIGRRNPGRASVKPRTSTTTEKPDVEDSDQPNVAVSTAVARGQYYILQPDGRLQRVVYMTARDPKSEKSGAYTAQLMYENVEPLLGPIFSYNDAPLLSVN